MGKKWIVHTLAENVEFRILKSGRDSALYEKTWKSALVGFSTSSDALDHLMTVEYSYGKRIDIALGEEMSRYQVQENFGRVTIISEKKQTSFCIRKVKKDVAQAVKLFLAEVAQAQQRKESSVLAEIEEEMLKNKRENTLKNLLSSPVPSQKLRRADGRMCYSDTKRKPSSIPDLEDKRQRSSSSPVRLCMDDDETPPKADKQKRNLHLKKFQHFRKAQSEVRHFGSRGDAAGCKENTSPTALERHGLSKGSFYGPKRSEPRFLEEMKKYKITHSSPSPKKRTPSKPVVDVHYRTAGSAIRALLQDTVPDKDDLGIRSLSESTGDDGVDPFKHYNQLPLMDRGNFASPPRKDGFENLGNTCYMNSTLQSLFGIIPFQKDLLELGEEIKSLLHPDSVLLSLINLMQHKSSSSSQKSALLRDVKHAISSNAKQFHGFAQQDAHEFVRLCLDLIKEEIAKLNRKEQGKTEDFIEGHAKIESPKKIICPITTNFCFTIKNEIACSKCNALTNREEDLYDLPVELRPKNSNDEAICLQKLVDFTFAEEKVEYVCDNCKHKHATVRKIVTKLPRILMIYLKRYSYNSAIYRSEKLRQRVSIPRYLTFCKHCDEKVEYTSADPTYFPQKPVYSPPIDAEAAPPTDKELEEFFKSQISACEVAPITQEASPISSRGSPDGNNNKRSVGTIVGGSSGDFSQACQGSAMEEAMQASVLEYYTKNPVEVPGELEIASMSEDDQIMLAIRLSMQENNQQNKLDSDFCISTPSSASISSDKVSSIQSASRLGPPQFDPVLCFDSPDKNDLILADGSPGNSGVSFNVSDPKPLLDFPEDEIPSLAKSCPSYSTSKIVIRQSSDEENLRNEAKSISSSATSSACYTSTPSTCSSATTGELIEQESSTCAQGVNDVDDEECNEMFKNLSTGHLPHSYHIVSIVSHKGGSSKFGHYVSDVLTDYSSNKWKCFDDNYVESFSEDWILLGREASCYLLFYVHK